MSKKSLRDTQRILDNWEDDLTEAVWGSADALNKSLMLGNIHANVKKLIEELLEAKEDQDYWIYGMN